MANENVLQGVGQLAGNVVGGGVIGGIQGLIGGLIAKRQQKRQQKYFEKNLKLQGEQQKQLLDYEAQVNDTYARNLARDSASINVLSRARAGLNPYATEGEGVTPVSNSMPSTQGAMPDMARMPDIGNLTSQGALMLAQIRDLKATAEGKELDNKWKNPLNEATLSHINAAISLAESNTKLHYSNIELNDTTKKDIAERLNMAKEQFPDILKNLRMSTDELQAKINQIEQGMKIDLQLLPANLKLSAAQAYAAYASGGANKASAEYTLKSIALLQPELQRLQRENKIGEATMNYEIAGAQVAYSREFQGLQGDKLDNKSKELHNQLTKSEMSWDDKTGLQKVDYVFGKVGQVVGIAQNLGVAYGGIQHGITQKSQRKRYSSGAHSYKPNTKQWFDR